MSNDITNPFPDTSPTAEPLIFTSMGNVPISALRHVPHWENHPDAIVFVDEYFFGDVSVKRGVNVLTKKGVNGETVIGDFG